MLDYARKMRLAVKDSARRLSLKAAAGVAVTIGLGFLLAALWTLLARHTGLGSLGASLVVGLIFVFLGFVIFVISNRAHHLPPTTDDLQAEVTRRAAGLAAAALERTQKRAEETLDRVQKKASRLVDRAENSAQSMADRASYGADRFAGRAETRAWREARRAGKAATERVEAARVKADAASDHLRRGARRARRSNLAAIAPVIGVLAAGITLASRLSGRHGPTPDDPRHGGPSV